MLGLQTFLDFFAPSSTPGDWLAPEPEAAATDSRGYVCLRGDQCYAVVGTIEATDWKVIEIDHAAGWVKLARRMPSGEIMQHWLPSSLVTIVKFVNAENAS